MLLWALCVGSGCLSRPGNPADTGSRNGEHRNSAFSPWVRETETKFSCAVNREWGGLVSTTWANPRAESLCILLKGNPVLETHTQNSMGMACPGSQGTRGRAATTHG